MSHALFKKEVLAKLAKPHKNKKKTAKILAKAYTKLILRHFETLTGGGRFFTAKSREAALKKGIQKIFEKNYDTNKKINLWKQLEPLIYDYWRNLSCIGPCGSVKILDTGKFVGPPIPENSDPKIWIKMLSKVAAVHIKTLKGIYKNRKQQISPWVGALLKTTA